MASKPRLASGALAKAEAALRAHALAKPEATEHFPWGERAIKVKGKVFLFMYADATRLSLSTKLPESGGVALMLPFAKPTGYGLGKAGWVTATFARRSQSGGGGAPDGSAGGAGGLPRGIDRDATPPLEMLCAWIDESYQAVAPAKLASLARGSAPASAAEAATAKPGTAKPGTAKPGTAKPGTAKPGTTKRARSARRPAGATPRPAAGKHARRPATAKPARRPATTKHPAKHPA